jgi:hypothetical protein
LSPLTRILSHTASYAILSLTGSYQPAAARRYRDRGRLRAASCARGGPAVTRPSRRRAFGVVTRAAAGKVHVLIPECTYPCSQCSLVPLPPLPLPLPLLLSLSLFPSLFCLSPPPPLLSALAGGRRAFARARAPPRAPASQGPHGHC